MDLTLAICVYNAERYLKETLQDIDKQTYKDFKLLIIDDCSNDSTIEIIENFVKHTTIQVSLIKLPKNKGIANARNIALNTAESKYILYIDGDDRISPFIVQKLYDRITSDHNIMAVTCWSKFIDSNGNTIGGGTYLGVKNITEFTQKASLGKLFFMPIHTMFDREIAINVGGFNTIGFPEGKPRYQDYCEELDLWTRMSDRYDDGKYFTTIQETLYSYRKSDGLSSNHFNMIIKMKYTKTNVLRRRTQLQDLTFIDFWNSLSTKEMKSIKTEAFAADALRNGVILLKKGKPLKGAWLILRSIIAQPSYFIDKIKHNL